MGISKIGNKGQACWLMPVIPALWEVKWITEVRNSDMVKPHLYKNTKNKNKKLAEHNGACNPSYSGG